MAAHADADLEDVHPGKAGEVYEMLERQPAPGHVRVGIREKSPVDLAIELRCELGVLHSGLPVVAHRVPVPPGAVGFLPSLDIALALRHGRRLGRRSIQDDLVVPHAASNAVSRQPAFVRTASMRLILGAGSKSLMPAGVEVEL